MLSKPAVFICQFHSPSSRSYYSVSQFICNKWKTRKIWLCGGKLVIPSIWPAKCLQLFICTTSKAHSCTGFETAALHHPLLLLITSHSCHLVCFRLAAISDGPALYMQQRTCCAVLLIWFSFYTHHPPFFRLLCPFPPTIFHWFQSNWGELSLKSQNVSADGLISYSQGIPLATCWTDGRFRYSGAGSLRSSVTSYWCWSPCKGGSSMQDTCLMMNSWIAVVSVNLHVKILAHKEKGEHEVVFHL